MPSPRSTTTDGQQILLAQADTTKPKKSSTKKKTAPKRAPKKDKDTMK